MNTIRIGTRGSQLALTQTTQVVEQLRALHAGVDFEIVVIKTTGDARQNVPFAAVGTKGMFVKEIEEALLSGEIDLGVHSMKDMPGDLPDGLSIVAVPRREDPRDALVSDGRTLAELPAGAVIGTSSLRRNVQVRAARPDVAVTELRGNLDTRLRKLAEGQYDAIILASAGLERMGWADRIVERLPAETFIPAPGQGALALEGRTEGPNDHLLAELLAPLVDEETRDAVTAERAFQATLHAGCGVPAGGFARVEGEQLVMVAMLAEPDGSRYRSASGRAPRVEAAALGEDLARQLLSA